MPVSVVGGWHRRPEFPLHVTWAAEAVTLGKEMPFEAYVKPGDIPEGDVMVVHRAIATFTTSREACKPSWFKLVSLSAKEKELFGPTGLAKNLEYKHTDAGEDRLTGEGAAFELENSATENQEACSGATVTLRVTTEA